MSIFSHENLDKVTKLSQCGGFQVLDGRLVTEHKMVVV